MRFPNSCQIRNKLHTEKLCWPCYRLAFWCIRLRTDLQNHSSNLDTWLPFAAAQCKNGGEAQPGRPGCWSSLLQPHRHPSSAICPLWAGLWPCALQAHIPAAAWNTGLTKYPPGMGLISILSSGLALKIKKPRIRHNPQPQQVPSIVFTASTLSRIWSMS